MEILRAVVAIINVAAGMYLGWVSHHVVLGSAVMMWVAASVATSVLSVSITPMGSWWQSYTPMQKVAGFCRGAIAEAILKRAPMLAVIAVVTYFVLRLVAPPA